MAANRNGGYESRSYYAARGTATAAGAGDNTLVTGDVVDRLIPNKGMAKSAKLVIAYDTTLTASQTLSFAAKLQDCATSGGTYADIPDTHLNTFAKAMTVVQSATGKGTVEFDFNLESAERYLKALITPDLSAGATDTVTWMATLILFGADGTPLSKSLI